MRALLPVAMVLSLCGATVAQESVLNRRIQADAPGAAVVWVPDGIASGAFAWRVAESARVPLMFEASPLDYRDPAIVAQRFDLEGLTVREALDLLVAQDPRYQWEERDGVVVIRPSGLSSDRDAALNRRIRGVGGTHLRLEDVLTRITAAVAGPGSSPDVPLGIDSGDFALDVPSGSALDVLVAAARAHGGVMWSVPSGTEGRNRTGFSLGFRTFAGGGAGGTGSAPR
jgi:hypothetical protein